jgi:hypothetical protein
MIERNLAGRSREAMDEYDLQKRREYARYKPEMAVSDAEGDVKRGAVKLFFLDVGEFPELVVIDEPLEKLPAAQRISIGIGCIDPINGYECPFEYRMAMENALNYAVGYNKAIAEAFQLRRKEEADSLPSATLDFFGLPDRWEAIRLELRDIQPIFGGRNVLLTGSGAIYVRTVRPGAGGYEEKIYRLAPDTGSRRRILHACITQDLLTLRPRVHSAPPHHARPEIVLINARGETFSVADWDPPLPGSDPSTVDRFNTIYREFRRLESMAEETSSPVHIGDAKDSRWKEILRSGERDAQ